jgi:hypothetical protein
LKCTDCNNHILNNNDPYYPVECKFHLTETDIENGMTSVGISVNSEYMKGNNAEACRGFVRIGKENPAHPERLL